MKTPIPRIDPNARRWATWALPACMALLTACGGGGDMGDAAPAPTAPATADDATAAAQDASTSAQALTANVRMQPQSSAGSGGLLTAGLSPAAVRQRYGFASLTSPAQQGSGQIIAVISAYNNPTAESDLNKFSAMHGLPPCRVTKSSLRRASSGYHELVNVPSARPGDGCEFQIINLDSSGRPAGRMVNGRIEEMVYGNDRVWATESTMDIEWAHAMAPQAKIVLIQVASPFPGALSFGIQYASGFANVVSMSWGQRESEFAVPCPASTLKKDPTCTPARMAIEALTKPPSNGSAGGWDTIAFGNPNVTYVAASGDSGNKPMWPAVSNKVLAVGGTRAIGPVDTGWSLSGGGLSAFYASPTWQRAVGPRRAVPDLSMVADSASPVSVYITPSPLQPDSACVAKRGAAACGWYMGYGTSVGAPMVAGLVAVTNAVRQEARLAPVQFTSALYAVASAPASYSDAFSDVIAGNNGFPAAKGFDLVTGLGTPVADRLVSLLARR